MKYRKKPVVVEAIQFTGIPDNVNAILAWVGDTSKVRAIMPHDPDPDCPTPEYHATHFYCPHCSFVSTDPHLIVKTLEGDMKASIYDYIIKGVNGEFYPCKPDIFEKTYEEVNE